MQPQQGTEGHAQPAPSTDISTDTPIGAALAATEDLESVPVAEHVARFEGVHAALSDALTTIDGE